MRKEKTQMANVTLLKQMVAKRFQETERDIQKHAFFYISQYFITLELISEFLIPI